MRAYISLHNLDFVYISEIYRDSTTALDDENLTVTGYNLLRTDHASNSKRDGVCVYYKSSLALGLTDVHYLQECLILEILILGNHVNSFIYINHQANLQIPLNNLQTICNSHYIK